MAEQRRRRRGFKFYAGAGIVVGLLLYLGDQNGWFKPAPAGRTGTVEPVAGQPDVDLADRTPRRGAGVEPDAVTADVRGDRPAPDLPPEKSGGDAGPGQTSDVARLDAALGMIDQLEHALRRQEIVTLARLRDGVQRRPIAVPAELAARWKELFGRVDAELRCGPHLRGLVRDGRVLAAVAFLRSVRGDAVPLSLRRELETAVAGFGWPDVLRSWSVRDPKAASPEPFDKRRLVRFVQGERIVEGRVWSQEGGRTTVRVAGASGYRYPEVKSVDIEPVNPTPDEALRQGQAAVAGAAPLTALVWSCYLQEHDAAELGRRLQAMLR